MRALHTLYIHVHVSPNVVFGTQTKQQQPQQQPQQQQQQQQQHQQQKQQQLLLLKKKTCWSKCHVAVHMYV